MFRPHNVTATLTWAPTSYEIDTSDSEDHVLAWYRAKRVINVMNQSGRTSINVIKN
jgi:hypothetical protein